jgi:hypothetical protein
LLPEILTFAKNPYASLHFGKFHEGFNSSYTKQNSVHVTSRVHVTYQFRHLLDSILRFSLCKYFQQPEFRHSKFLTESNRDRDNYFGHENVLGKLRRCRNMKLYEELSFSLCSVSPPIFENICTSTSHDRKMQSVTGGMSRQTPTRFPEIVEIRFCFARPDSRFPTGWLASRGNGRLTSSLINRATGPVACTSVTKCNFVYINQTTRSFSR